MKRNILLTFYDEDDWAIMLMALKEARDMLKLADKTPENNGLAAVAIVREWSGPHDDPPGKDGGA